MSAPLVLAIPSKGRLQENAAAFFARSGLAITKGNGARDYRGQVEGLPGVEIAFLSAGEIVRQLGAGSVHLGVTGEDLLRETLADADSAVELLAPLGFGNADVVVAVPQGWIDVRGMADLEDVAAAFRAKRGERMRVATKYINLTRAFFSKHGVTDYRIVESLGATEGAPAAGQAELIVDITTTGATLRANALKVIEDGVLLRSEANLAASLKAHWSAEQRDLARTILARISAEEAARTTRELRCHGALPAAGALAEGLRLFGARTLGEGRAFISPRAKAADFAGWLVRNGAGDVTVAQNDYVFTAENALFERLSKRLG